MIVYLQQHQTELKRDSQLTSRVVYQELVSTIDSDRIAGLLVVGRLYWQSASPTQREYFTCEFEKLVISTYSLTLASCEGDKAQFYPKYGNWECDRTNDIDNR